MSPTSTRVRFNLPAHPHHGQVASTDVLSSIMASDRLQRQIERLLDEADQAITQEDWPTVASRARAVLRIDPDNSDAISYLAVAERDTTNSQSSQEPPASSPVSSVVSDQPASFANDRYQVKRFLGEGGKKNTVFNRLFWMSRRVAVHIETCADASPATSATMFFVRLATLV